MLPDPAALLYSYWSLQAKNIQTTGSDFHMDINVLLI